MTLGDALPPKIVLPLPADGPHRQCSHIWWLDPDEPQCALWARWWWKGTGKPGDLARNPPVYYCDEHAEGFQHELEHADLEAAARPGASK